MSHRPAGRLQTPPATAAPQGLDGVGAGRVYVGHVTFYPRNVCGPRLQVADRFLAALTGRLAGLPFERSADELLGPEAYAKRQRQDNSAEQNPERQTNDPAANAETLNGDGHGEYRHQPFHA